jgi:hypothetical protein
MAVEDFLAELEFTEACRLRALQMGIKKITAARVQEIKFLVRAEEAFTPYADALVQRRWHAECRLASATLDFSFRSNRAHDTWAFFVKSRDGEPLTVTLSRDRGETLEMIQPPEEGWTLEALQAELEKALLECAV